MRFFRTHDGVFSSIFFFFSTRCRDLYPSCYSNQTPHALVLDKRGPYQGVFDLMSRFRQGMDGDPTLHPTPAQVYKVFFDFLEVPTHEVRFPSDLTEEDQVDVWRSVHCRSLGARCTDLLWRIASGSLKTGSVLAGWNMPGVRELCPFCDLEPETVVHLFSSCPALRQARGLVKEKALELYGVSVVSPPDAFWLTAVLPDGVPVGLRQLVSYMNKAVWETRNRLIFEGDNFCFQELKARFFAWLNILHAHNGL